MRKLKTETFRISGLRLFLFVSLLLSAIMLAVPGVAPAGVSISVTIAPPAIPVYVQPLCPGPGFMWVPGYWAWDPDDGYYWVPGMWSPAPFVGALWTPGYWGWSDGVYLWHEGYWGPVVGFYGGINYGFGYSGAGYYGGYWRGGAYYYNRTVNNVSVTNITNVYSKTVVNVRPAGPSFNGGRGGTVLRPTSEQLTAARERRFSLTPEQERHVQLARTNPDQRANVNHGRPTIAATPKPGVFSGHGIVRASRAGAPYRAPRIGQGAPNERLRTPKSGAGIGPSGTPRTAEPRFSRPAERSIAPRTPGRQPEPRLNQPRSERMPPRTFQRETEGRAYGRPTPAGPGTARPMPQRQYQQRQYPQKERNGGERREER